MARVTIEDCIEAVPNSFDLVILAAQRAREISQGDSIRVDDENDKKTVIALREIAVAAVAPETLREAAIRRLQVRAEDDDSLPLEGDAFEAMSMEEIAAMQAAGRESQGRQARALRESTETSETSWRDDPADSLGDSWSD